VITVIKHYIKSDGNGGIAIGKYTMALLMLVVVIVCASVPFVFGYGQVNNRISNLEKVWDEASITHPAYVEKTDDRIRALEAQSAVILQKLEMIESDIKEIKTDIKDIKRG